MKEFTNTIQGVDVKFSVDDDPSIAMINGLLGYDAKRIDLLNDERKLPLYVVVWEASKHLIVDWECDLIPDLHEDFLGVYPEKKKSKKETSIDEKNAVAIVRIIEYVGLQVAQFRQELEGVEKN